MRRLLPFTVSALLPFSLAAAEPATVVPNAAVQRAVALRDQALKDETAYDFTAALTTEIGPRLSGGVNDLPARNWTIARFKALGFDKVWTEPVTYPKWVRRSEHAEVIAPFAHPLAATALGYSAPTPKGGLTAEIVAFDTLDALKQATPQSVKGHIVYVGPRMHPHRDGHDYGIGSAVRSGGPSIAAKLGAAAFLLRSAGTDSNRLPHTGVTIFEAGVKPIPAAAISSPDADMLESMLHNGGKVTVKLALDCGLEGSYTGANVIGEVTGRSQPNEAFVMGGHLDSWDLGTGALDDGVGVAIGAAAAHLIAQMPERPARSVRVVAFANEESGLFGGKAFAEAHKNEIANYVLGSESDLGADRIYSLTASVKPSALGAVDQIMQVLAPLGIERAIGPAFGGSDLSEVHKVGMAAISLHQDATRYFDWHHTANDTLDKIDREQLRQNVATYAVVAYMAASAEGDFGSGAGAFASDGGE